VAHIVDTTEGYFKAPIWVRSPRSSTPLVNSWTTAFHPFTIGIHVSGNNGGDFRVSLSSEGMTYEPGEIESLHAYIEFDAGSMALTAFGRGNFGTVRGDGDLAEKYLNLFFRI
jgi:hypothetical protein